MSKKDNVDMTFWEHLTELFKQLRKVLVVFIVSTIAVMVVPINLDFTNLNLSNPFYQTITTYVIQHIQKRFLPPGITLIPLIFCSVGSILFLFHL